MITMEDFDGKLALEFDTDSRDFARGVQVGMVYERFCGKGGDGGDILVYSDCAEMLARMRDAGACFTITDSGDDNWIRVTPQ